MSLDFNEGIHSEVSKMTQEHKDDVKNVAGVAAAGAGAAVGTKYATGARALKVASSNPQRVARLASEYQHASGGRRALTPKGWADNKLHPDLVKRKLNHGITHWEDAGGVKLNRKIRANPDSKLLRLHPRYAEHKILNQAVAAAPTSHKNLYRGVTMHPSEAAQLKAGNHMQRGVESWTDDKRKAKVFADNRRAKVKSERDHVRVVYKMPKGSKALNIQGQSGWNMSEWVADQPYKIHSVKQTKKGNYKVRVKQSQLSPVQKSWSDAATAGGAAAGGAGAYGAYLGSGNAIARANNKFSAKKYQENRKANDKKVKAVKRQLGIPSNKPIKDYRAHEKNAFFRNYPTDVPGGRVKRAQAVVWGAEKYGRKKPAAAVVATGAIGAGAAVHHHVEKMSPRAAMNATGAKVGAHWTVNLSRAADRIEPYTPAHGGPRKGKLTPITDKHIPNFKAASRKFGTAARGKAAETVRAASYDVSSLNDKDKMIREVSSGQGKIKKAYSLDMHEGVHSLVSKMSPDPSELHVAGNSGQKRKGRLRKAPPEAIRRT